MQNRLDHFLIHPPAIHLSGLKRFSVEFVWFGIKELRACLFAGLFFLAIFCVPRSGMAGIARIGFFIWLAENMGTFFGIWQYPNQIGAWATVHAGKWGAWSLLVIMTFTITLFLKDIKKRVHIAQ